MGREKKSLNSFKFVTFIGRFQSDGAASMAVKGLISTAVQYVRIFGVSPFFTRKDNS